MPFPEELKTLTDSIGVFFVMSYTVPLTVIDWANPAFRIDINKTEKNILVTTRNNTIDLYISILQQYPALQIAKRRFNYKLAQGSTKNIINNNDFEHKIRN